MHGGRSSNKSTTHSINGKFSPKLLFGPEQECDLSGGGDVMEPKHVHIWSKEEKELWLKEAKKRWAEDPWKFTRSAVTTLLAAADAIVKQKQPGERDKWFEEMLGEVTDPLRSWWAQLKEDYDRNPSHKAEWSGDKTPDGALLDFYLECQVALVDPLVADETRVKAKALIDRMKATRKTLSPEDIPVAIPDKIVNVVINDELCPPVRLTKPTETPDELVELAINRIAEACRKYWAEAKADPARRPKPPEGKPA
jgi:hypothetical protein